MFNASVTTLNAGTKIYTGTPGDDVFVGSYNDAGSGTFNPTVVIDGGAGFDTLDISPIGVAAVTPSDSLWAHVSNIEEVVINTSGAGAQTLTTGAFFEAAFGASGVALSTTSDGGAMTLNTATFDGALALNTSSGAGAQTITTGNGSVSLDAVSGAGAQTITTGLGHADVISTAGAGAQTITGANLGNVTAISTSTGAGDVNVAATVGSGALTISTGAGNDQITVTGSSIAGAVNVSAGAGADSITLLSNGLVPAHVNILIGHADSGITLASADQVFGFDDTAVTLAMGVAASAANYAESDVVVADYAAALSAANIAMAGLTGADRFSFQSDGSNGYLFHEFGGQAMADQVVVLSGVTAAHFSAANVIA